MKRVFSLGPLSLLGALALIAATTAPAAAQSFLYSVAGIANSVPDNNLRRIDPATGNTLASVPITVPGKTVISGNGLATHPGTGQLYAVLTFQGQESQRFLATVDPQTGVGTIVGNMGDRFSGLAFAADGTLFGVTGDNANGPAGPLIPETLYTLSTSTGQPTLFQTLGHGSDGEAIAYNPGDGRLYHASGFGQPNVDQIFEAVNLQTKAISPITLSGFEASEITALAYSQAFFLAADLFQNLMMITPQGAVTQIGALDHVSKGLAFAAPAAPTTLVASVLPSSRAVSVSTPATAFASVLNAGPNTAIGVGIGLASQIDAFLTYNATNCATNAVVGGDNVPVNVNPGAQACFVITIQAFSPFPPTEVAFNFAALNAPAVPTLAGINTLLMSASDTPGPDIIALAATPTGNGIVDIPGTNGIGAFSVATANVGTGGLVTASANTGGAILPILLQICETNPANAQCKAPPATSVTTQVDAGKTPTFSVFAFGGGTVPFDPATNRIVVEFRVAGQVDGRTSVAVRTNPQ